jgi:hypothetical protein
MIDCGSCLPTFARSLGVLLAMEGEGSMLGFVTRIGPTRGKGGGVVECSLLLLLCRAAALVERLQVTVTTRRLFSTIARFARGTCSESLQ